LFKQLNNNKFPALDVCGVLGYSKVVFLLSHGFKPFYASIISVSTLLNMQVSFRWNARCVWYILSATYVPAYEFIRVYSVLSFSFEIIYIVHKLKVDKCLAFCICSSTQVSFR